MAFKRTLKQLKYKTQTGPEITQDSGKQCYRLVCFSMKTQVRTPLPFGHADGVVEKFPARVFAVQAAGTIRVIRNLLGQLLILVGNAQLIQRLPETPGIQASLDQSKVEGFPDLLGPFPKLVVISRSGIRETGPSSRIQSDGDGEKIEVPGSPIDRSGGTHGEAHDGPMASIGG